MHGLFKCKMHSKRHKIILINLFKMGKEEGGDLTYCFEGAHEFIKANKA